MTSRLPLVPFLLGLVLVPAGVRAEVRAVKQPHRNSFVIGPSLERRSPGLAVRYERGLIRRLSVSGQLEYSFQPRGFWHLQGFGETIGLAIWPKRTFDGFFAEASLNVSHQLLVFDSSLSTTAVAPGASLGWRFVLPKGFGLGIAGGFRWRRIVDDEPTICTIARSCPAVQPGLVPRFGLELSYAF